MIDLNPHLFKTEDATANLSLLIKKINYCHCERRHLNFLYGESQRSCIFDERAVVSDTDVF